MHPQAIHLSRDMAGRLVLVQCFLCSVRPHNAGDNISVVHVTVLCPPARLRLLFGVVAIAEVGPR